MELSLQVLTFGAAAVLNGGVLELLLLSIKVFWSCCCFYWRCIENQCVVDSNASNRARNEVLMPMNDAKCVACSRKPPGKVKWIVKEVK
jgi:hypothetical protein